MNGAAAVADALLRYTDRKYTIPGYPVTEISELCNAELVLNEKIALEYALGDSLTGKRAAVIIKHVGINACADPLLHATTQGLVGGVILVAGDDPDAAGSQTAQDSRYYGELAEVPVIEPDGSCCYAAIEAALEASEQFSRVAIIRLTPSVLEREAENNPVSRRNGNGRLADRGWTMNGRVTAAEELYRTMFTWSSRSPLNRWDGGPAGVGPAPGKSRIVVAHPVPAQAAQIREISECGRTYVRDHRGILPPPPQACPRTMEDRGFARTFCRECPFRLMMDILKRREMPVVCDAGCSILLLNRPYELGVASYGMGSSIAVAARSTRLAVIGDYALLHSGLNALIDIYGKRLPLLCIVMKNTCAGMIGRQPVPDPLPCIQWADPVVCRADDAATLERELVVTDRPRTLVVEGICPEGSTHETVGY
jgi:TPP-dependent indolepyruvate ferredoxin oxidoreductase alpha subunit